MRNKLTKFLTSECPPKGMRQFAKTWKYAACMLLAFTLAIGNVLAAEGDPVSFVPSAFATYSTARAIVSTNDANLGTIYYGAHSTPSTVTLADSKKSYRLRSSSIVINIPARSKIDVVYAGTTARNVFVGLYEVTDASAYLVWQRAAGYSGHVAAWLNANANTEKAADGVTTMYDYFRAKGVATSSGKISSNSSVYNDFLLQNDGAKITLGTNSSKFYTKVWETAAAVSIPNGSTPKKIEVNAGASIPAGKYLLCVGDNGSNVGIKEIVITPVYQLTWDFDGGSTSAVAGDDYTAAGYYVKGASLTYPENSTMSKTSYIFTDWSSSATAMPASALTITAQWALAGSAYDVNIASMTNGSVVASPASQVEDGIVTLTVTPDDGYLLSSLSVVGDVSGDEVTVTANQFTMPAEDVTINATFSLAPTYTVTLNPAGGTIVDATGWTLNAGNYEKEVAEGTVLTLPTFTKDGRTFKTWRKAGPADVASPVTVDGDLSLTAIWTATIEQGIYSWESPDGTPIEVGGTAKFYNGDTDASSTAAPDNRVNYANKPVSGDDVTQYYTLRLDKAVDYSTEHVRISLNSALKEGDKIAITAYYTKEQAKTVAPKIANGSNEVVCSADNLANLYNGGTPATQTKTLNDKAEGATTLKLTRSATSTTAFITKLQIIREVQVEEGDLLTVTLNYNDGVTPNATIQVASGQAVAQPANPTWAHHRFNEWQLAGSAYDFSSAVTADITLVANWTQLYTITYAAGDGTATGDAPTEADKAATETFTVAANPFTVAGKDFVKWNDGTNDYAPGATYTVGTDNVVLTAQWKAAADKYTVIFKDGTTELGTKLFDVTTNPSDADIDKTKALNTFAAWQKEGVDIALDDAFWASVAKDAEITLTARWAKAFATSVDLEGLVETSGTGADWQKYLSDHGYAFSTSNVSLDEKKDPSENKPYDNWPYQGLKAKVSGAYVEGNIEADKLVIIKLGHMAADATVTIDGVAQDNASGLDAAEPAGAMNYYYLASEGLLHYETTNAGACILKAITITDPFTVTFDANGGDDVASLNGTPSVMLPSATKGTESFLGWFDADDNKIGEAGETYTPTANITLKAHWEAVSTDARLASITFSAAGTLSPAFDPEVTNYTYTMPYGTAAVPTITGATKANPAAKDPVIDAQATAWGETAHVHGVAASDDTKDYYVQMLRAPKDGASIFKAELTSATTATYSGIYADADNSQIKLADDGANGYKFSGTSNFIKMTLDGGTFATGDLLTMTYSKDPQQGELAIYENTTKIVGTSFENHTLEFTAGADGLTELFIRRTSDNDFNGWVSVVEVTRVVNPILTAITFAGEAGTINESLKTVTVTVPNATDLGSMTVVPTIVRNAPHATTPEAVITNAGAWVEGPNTYRIMDKDGDYTDYTVTITRAALSDDATLSLLTVNGQAIALADGVFEYSFELPYGTSSAPTVVATPHHIAAVATVDPCTLSGATITVVPESGAGDQKVYTLTFTISPWKEVVIWDGSYMTDVETSPDATGLAWEAVGCTGIENWAYATDEPNGKVPAYCSDNDKTYTHVNGSGKNECNIFRTGGNTKNTRYFQITVPAGYVAKFYVVYGSHSEGTELTMSIGTEASATATDGILSLTTDHRYLLSGGMSEVVGAGDYYLNATGSADFFEIRAYLRPGYGRKVSNNIGTLCVDHNVPAGAALGATFYQLVGKEPTYGKLVFDEVTELEAGEPYIFESTTGSIALYYGETVAATPVEVNHMIGSYVDTKVTITEENKKSVMYISNNKLWDCSDYLDWTSQEQKLQVVANRAYIANYDAIGAPASASPAPGRRRITVGKDGQNAATDVDLLNAAEAPVKMIIDGKMYILRGEKMYDATGRLVK